MRLARIRSPLFCWTDSTGAVTDGWVYIGHGSVRGITPLATPADGRSTCPVVERGWRRRPDGGGVGEDGGANGRG